jgi:hypothetical protein
VLEQGDGGQLALPALEHEAQAHFSAGVADHRIAYAALHLPRGAPSMHCQRYLRAGSLRRSLNSICSIFSRNAGEIR